MRQKAEYNYIVTLRHPDYKVYNAITILMCMLTVAAAIYGLLKTPFINYTWVNVFLIVFIIFNAFVSIIDKDKPGNIATFKWSLYAAAFLWLLYPLHIPYISIFFIIAALLERQVKFPREIGFSREAITFNTFPYKSFSWQQVSNTMIKDDILTIDFRNNKMIQKEIEPAELTEDENEFNEFCRECLSLSK